jgi:hypothetical protein
MTATESEQPRFHNTARHFSWAVGLSAVWLVRSALAGRSHAGLAVRAGSALILP